MKTIHQSLLVIILECFACSALADLEKGEAHTLTRAAYCEEKKTLCIDLYTKDRCTVSGISEKQQCVEEITKQCEQHLSSCMSE